MKFAPILPIGMLEKHQTEDLLLVLPHLLQTSTTYKEFHTKATNFKILDNGAAESRRVGISELLDLAGEIEADEVVLPDVIGDMEATVAVFKSLPTWVWDTDQKYQAVLQGKNVDELRKCLDLYEPKVGVITTIAFPRALNRDNPYGRREAINELYEEVHEYGFEIHCLGASHPADEAKELALMGCVRSIDTSLPAVFGLEKAELDSGYINRQDYFFDDFGVSDEVMEVIDGNLATYRSWCANGRPGASY